MPASLADRLAARCLVGSLSEAESAAYVLGRLARAGATSPLFGEEALSALHLAADGVPRRLNNGWRTSRLSASPTRDRETPDAETVAIAAKEAAFEAGLIGRAATPRARSRRHPTRWAARPIATDVRSL